MLDNKQYIKTTIASNKNFGFTFTIIFFLIFIYCLLHDYKVSLLFLIVSILFLILTILAPKFLSIPNKLWFKFGMFLSSYIANPLIMFIIFFFVVTPIGLLMKIFTRNKNKKKISNWVARLDELSKDMKNQF